MSISFFKRKKHSKLLGFIAVEKNFEKKTLLFCLKIKRNPHFFSNPLTYSTPLIIYGGILYIYVSLYYTIHEFQQWITMTIILSIDKLVSLKFRFQSFSEQKINYLSMSIPCMIEYITSKNSLSKNVHVYNYFSCRLDWQDSSMCNGYQQPKKGGGKQR